MRTLARSLALLLALAGAGCSVMVDPEKNDPVATAEGFCNSIQDTLARFPCGNAQTAVEQLYGYLRTSCDTLQVAVDEGRFAYDSGQAAACLDAVRRLGCRGVVPGASTFDWPEACQAVLRGNVPLNGECTYQEWATGSQQATGTSLYLRECVAGTGCYSTTGASCGGTCVPPALQGESCRGGRPCEPGLVCTYESICRTGTLGSPCLGNTDCATGNQCVGGFCQSNPTTGELCTYYPGCDVNNVCDTAVGVCVARRGEGEPCPDNNLYCRAGLSCWAGVCKAPARQGESCASNSCLWDEATHLYCQSSTATCRTYPREPLPRGADCSGLGTGGCADGLFCDSAALLGTPSVCQPQFGPGEDCSINGSEVCRAGTTCYYDSMASPPTSTCLSLPTLGAACDTMSGVSCENGLYCRTAGGTVGVCASSPTDGEPCGPGGGAPACAPGHYMSYPPPGVACLCARVKGVGEACTADDECGFHATGRRCVPGGAGLTCQLVYTCEVPIGWFPVGAFL